MEVMVSDVFPVLCRLTVCAVLDLPTSVLGKLRLELLRVAVAAVTWKV
jgi:hypothetical protein